jgi:putative membrane protein
MKRAAWASIAVAATGMVATPLARRAGSTRRRLASVVVTGLAATTLASTARRWGSTRAVSAAAVVSLATAGVERVGSRSGIPFGAYRYTAALRPQLAGVPVLVPAAWFAMALPARETAVAALGPRLASRRFIRWLGGAALLTAWDLFLDPQMVGEGYWLWSKSGRYRGIPLTNFAGWMVTGVGLMAALDLLAPPDPIEPDVGLVSQYAFIAGMETLGFAAFFRDRVVAATGGVAMLSPSLLAGYRLCALRS